MYKCPCTSPLDHFYRNLRMGLKTGVFCSWWAFPAQCNVTLKLFGPILKLWKNELISIQPLNRILLTSILSRMDGEKMYIPALILLETNSGGFSTNFSINPVFCCRCCKPFHLRHWRCTKQVGACASTKSFRLYCYLRTNARANLKKDVFSCPTLWAGGWP
jgi:hypothetical protein